MSRCFDFYATEPEIVELWRWLWDHAEFTIMESASRPDQPLRDFVEFPHGELDDRSGTFALAAYPERFRRCYKEEQILFDEDGQRWTGARGRTARRSPASIRISKLNAPKDMIGPYQIYYETEFTANLLRFPLDTISCVDWQSHDRLIKLLKKEIKRRFKSKWRDCPLSDAVIQLLKDPNAKLWLWGKTGNPIAWREER